MLPQHRLLPQRPLPPRLLLPLQLHRDLPFLDLGESVRDSPSLTPRSGPSSMATPLSTFTTTDLHHNEDTIIVTPTSLRTLVCILNHHEHLPEHSLIVGSPLLWLSLFFLHFTTLFPSLLLLPPLVLPFDQYNYPETPLRLLLGGSLPGPVPLVSPCPGPYPYIG